MADLENREKKRGPLLKSGPVKAALLKETEAYLADYFGEASLPSRPSPVLRPPKRPEYFKPSRPSNSTPSSTSASATLNFAPTTNTKSDAVDTNTKTYSDDKQAPAGSRLDGRDVVRLATPTPVAEPAPPPPKAFSLSEQDLDPEVLIIPDDMDGVNSIVLTDEPPSQRLRSSSRRTEQGSLRRANSRSGDDQERAGTEEASEMLSDPKPVFAVPHPKTFKSPIGKENHIPRTPLGSRTIFKTMAKTDGPRLNWGRPQREVPDHQDDQRATGSSDDINASAVEARIDNDKRESHSPSTVPSSASPSPEALSQDSIVDDIPVGRSRGRQGSHRDYDESASVAKKMKHSREPSPERLLQLNSVTQLEPQKSSAPITPIPVPASVFIPSTVSTTKARSTVTAATIATTTTTIATPVSISTAAGSAAAPISEPSAPSSQRQEIPRKPIVTHVAPRVAITIDLPTESVALPPTSPRITSRPQMSPATTTLSQFSVPRPKGIPTEGIASIAQSLAVGAPNPFALPRQYPPSSHEVNGRAGDSSAGFFVNSPSLDSQGAARGERQVFVVNRRPYTKLSQVGKGGSSKVYKVIASNGRVFALKKVSFERADQTTINGFVNEINLLRRLENNSRIIRLWDAEIYLSKGYLSLIMEYGETDLAIMLLNQREQEFDLHFIGLYWRQMLEAVQVIHDEKIVHSDLKPANFLLVEGSLKLIDFGIANAIANDTTNVHREGQLGTANYMAPEAISSNPGTSGYRKLGRASDVWSLGCILYQMVYGKPPFSDILNVFQKLSVIASPTHRIEFPEMVLSPLQLPKRSSRATTTTTTTTTNAASTTAAVAVAVAGTAPPPGTGGETGRISGGGDLDALQTTTTKPASELAMDGSTVVAQQRTVVVDARLIRLMKGCLARLPNERLTIPEMLEDPLLRADTFKTSSPSSESSTLLTRGGKDSVTMDMDTLRQVMQASMIFGATRAVAETSICGPAGGGSSNGDMKRSEILELFGEREMQAAAKDMMLQLQRPQEQEPKREPGQGTTARPGYHISL